MLNSAQDPLSFDDLSAIYRVERKAPTLSLVRKDLYPAMASLLVILKTEYERQLAIDPESLVCEGAAQHRKRAVQLSKEIVQLRMQKICSLAQRGAMGAHNVIDALTAEEKEYYTNILTISKKHSNILNRLSGNKRYETPDIDTKPLESNPIVNKITDRTEKDTKIVVENVPVEKKIVEDDVEDIPMIPMEDDMDLIDVTEEEFIPEDDLDRPVKRIAEEDAHIPDDEETDENGNVLIRILEDLPPFSGPERDYSLSKEDVLTMPKLMADILINRNKAVLINPSE